MQSRRLVIQKSSPLLLLAFGALFVLILASGVLVVRDSREIFTQMERAQSSHQQRNRLLNNIQLDTGRIAILLRDVLLDPGPSEVLRREINERRQSIERSLAQLDRDPAIAHDMRLDHLRQELTRYRQSIEPIFTWTAAERQTRSLSYLRRVVAPHRERILSVAHDVESLVAANLAAEQQAQRSLRDSFRRSLSWTLSGTLLLGLGIAAMSFKRLSTLESRSASLQHETEQHRLELRTLSQKLVRAQEEERKSISRELHDQVGQMLTAIQMEFRNLGILREAPGREFDEHLRGGQTLAERTLQAVRNMAMGLRPSMLDDLGLAPALQWQAREFTQRSGIPVKLEIDGELDDLPEGPRTCLYRVVQEALTNCARHAEAKEVRVALHGSSDRVLLTVQDDGKGFDPQARPNRGLGLIGIEERVREIGGRVSIFSQPRKGTLLRAEVPVNEQEQV
jgi:signal transduction histidine kinase